MPRTSPSCAPRYCRCGPSATARASRAAPSPTVSQSSAMRVRTGPAAAMGTAIRPSTTRTRTRTSSRSSRGQATHASASSPAACSSRPCAPPADSLLTRCRAGGSRRTTRWVVDSLAVGLLGEEHQPRGELAVGEPRFTGLGDGGREGRACTSPVYGVVRRASSAAPNGCSGCRTKEDARRDRGIPRSSMMAPGCPWLSRFSFGRPEPRVLRRSRLPLLRVLPPRRPRAPRRSPRGPRPPHPAP